MKTKIIFLLAFLITANLADARINPEILKKMKDRVPLAGSRSDCQPSQAQYVMEINNVRANLLAGGDLWWDFQDGQYIVPKPAPGFPEVSAIFASGIWMGGMDPNGALKIAGVTYRQGNNTDFYAGPLNENGQTNNQICNDWDRHFVVKGENIREHNRRYRDKVINGIDYPCDEVPDDIKYWPARGNPHFNDEYDFELPDQNLADFFDEDFDGIYDPCKGDFPILSIRGCENAESIPDEIVFWIFNDNGGPHRLTQTTPIQIEVQANAFAFKSSDELNDMTFYKYKVTNKASDDIRDCYFGLWTDPDLGCSEDDFIGCDIDRSLAYIYNEDAVDGSPGSACPGGVNTYGTEVPMLGIDYFRGPRGPKVFCGEDENGNPILCDPPLGSGQVDTFVTLGMTSFTYQNRGVSGPPEATQDPAIDFEFYNILRGLWKDGTPITFGGSGFDPQSADYVKFAFSDPPSDPNGWSMCTADLPFDDRRMVQSTGPVMLQPGMVNELIFGVVFVPDVDYPCPSIERLQFADDIAQALFDNCFSIGETPCAPDMSAVRLDKQLILTLSNNALSNNYQENFMEVDLNAPQEVEDKYYKFEGYKIYQLENANVNVQELDNIDKARLIRQVDVKNGVKDIYNWFPIENPDPTVTSPIWIPERQVIGSDLGIEHSFNITQDAFADGNMQLKNGKDYHFLVLAYAHNNWMQYDVMDNIGQRTPYIESKKNVKVYSFSPRSLADVDVPTEYGQEAAITRIEGIGTSNNSLDMDLTQEQIDAILNGSFDGIITYKAGKGPINPKVIDPLGIEDGMYRLEIVGEYLEESSNEKFIQEGALWKLTDLNTGEEIDSYKTIEEINEQIIPDRGFSISVNQVKDPGDRDDDMNGAISQNFEYADDVLSNWWNAIPGYSGAEVEVNQTNVEYVYPFVDVEDEDDPENRLSRIGPGHFIPFKSARWLNSQTEPYITPGWKGFQGFALTQDKLRLKELNNVDIVFTSDKSKWSKCIVVESAVDDYKDFGLSTVGNSIQFDLRNSPSIDLNGNVISGDMGMSYFPGYAIDVETGERLNIFFGENSVFNTNNDAIYNDATGLSVDTRNIGSDMIWNPSSELFTVDNESGGPGTYNSLAGGQHYIYVTRQEYDECAVLKDQLESGGLLNTIEAVSFITWTGVPLPQEPLLSLEAGLIPNDLTIKLRVTNPFNRELDIPNYRNSKLLEAVGGFPVYEFGFKDVEVTGTVSTESPRPLGDVIVSPNPFYDNSANGQGQSGDVVRVSNLPKGSVVTIFTFDGKFIRQMSDGTDSNFIDKGSLVDLEWDLNDRNGSRISTGMYIVNIVVPHLGVQKSFKWVKI